MDIQVRIWFTVVTFSIYPPRVIYLPSAKLCPALCDPMHWSPPDSSVQGILQVRILEWIAIPSSRGSSQNGSNPCLLWRILKWVAISFSRGSSQSRDRTWVSRIVDRRFTVWATREVCYHYNSPNNYTAHHNAGSAGALSLFFCSWKVPSGGDGRVMGSGCKYVWSF